MQLVLYADDWKHLICSQFYSVADNVKELYAQRLVPLDKNPGIRPIGIEEVLTSTENNQQGSNFKTLKRGDRSYRLTTDLFRP